MPYTINGIEQDLPAPVLGEGTTFVPLAGVVETLGGYVTYDALTKTANIELGEHKARVEADNAMVEADGQNITLQDSPYLENNTLYVPVRFFESSLGCKIDVHDDAISVSNA